MRSFMIQMTESITLLHTKVDNMAFRLVVCEKKLRNLSNLVSKGKKSFEDSDSSDEGEGNKSEEGEESNEKEKEDEEAEKEKEKKDGSNADLGDSSETDSDAAPLISRATQRRYSTRNWELRSKFKNTPETALELSPSPSPSPSPAPSTPIHNASSTSPSP